MQLNRKMQLALSTGMLFRIFGIFILLSFFLTETRYFREDSALGSVIYKLIENGIRQVWDCESAVAVCHPDGVLSLLPEIIFFFCILILDVKIYFELSKILVWNKSRLLYSYWLSPLVFAVFYLFGVGEIFGAALVVYAYLMVSNMKLFRAGVIMTVSVFLNPFSLIIAPLFVAYFTRSQQVLVQIKYFVRGAIAATAVLGSIVYFGGINTMPLHLERLLVPEISDMSTFFLVMMNYLKIGLTILLVYSVFQIKRISKDIIGVAFTLTMLIFLIPSFKGVSELALILPLALISIVKADKQTFLNFQLLALFTVFTVVFFTFDYNILTGFIDVGHNSFIVTKIILYLLIIVSIIIQFFRVWKYSLTSLASFSIAKRPVSIGIAGDSGSGKDSFAAALTGLFGGHSTVMLSGDDYHLWDRNKPSWKILTHLNPRANNLDLFAKHFLLLRNRSTVIARQYDHSAGKMTKSFKKKSNDYLLVNGLHSLYLPEIRNQLDLKVFLDIDENLRLFFKLRRDVVERQQSIEKVFNSLDLRKADKQSYISPQADFADIIFSVQPVNNDDLAKCIDDIIRGVLVRSTPRLKLKVRSKYIVGNSSLLRVLVGTCGLLVDRGANTKFSRDELIIEGEVLKEDIEMSADKVFRFRSESLDLNPRWLDGVAGLMQLFTLVHLEQSLKARNYD